MNVILKQDVENLGFEFEVVDVKPGYARNFLIPRGLATVATPKAKEELAQTLEARRVEEEALISTAKEKSSKLNGLEIKLEAKVGSGDRLFGSVNNADLADALVKAGVEIEKKNIKIPGNTIKRLGKYTAKVRFHREVEVDFDFDIVPDAESIAKAEAAAKTRAELAKLDAAKAEAIANQNDGSSFNFDNPLYEKPKKVVTEEVIEEPKTEE